MAEQSPSDPYAEVVGGSPTIELDTMHGILPLTYENTRVCTFGEGFEPLNHLKYTTSDDESLRISLENVDTETIAELILHCYPTSFDPIPIAADSEWYDNRFAAKYGIPPPREITPPPSTAKRKQSVTGMIVGGAFNMLFGEIT